MNARVAELSGIIRDTLTTPGQIHTELQQAIEADIVRLGRTNRSALIVAGLLESYYTCLETAFLRISQHFENTLAGEKWHRDLLETMQLDLEGIRVAAVSKQNLPRLLELLKFRHFKRYYFQVDYDWRKLEYLRQVLEEAHPLVERDLSRFDAFLHRL